MKMTDRERLIELIEQAERKEISDFITADIDEKIDMSGGTKISCSMEYLVDYLLEHRVIVPPCKVGDMVYSWKLDWDKEGDIVPYQITNITVTQNKKGVWTKKYRAMQVINGKTIDWQLNFAFDEIGETVFLTFEEAERKLKERESNA